MPCAVSRSSSRQLVPTMNGAVASRPRSLRASRTNCRVSSTPANASPSAATGSIRRQGGWAAADTSRHDTRPVTVGDMADAVVADLRAGLPDSAVQDDPDVVAGYARDMAMFAPSEQPRCVVLPADTAQVQHVIRVAGRHRVPVVPRGAGSGLAGSSNGVAGGITLVLTRMNRIVEIDPANRLAVVEPGVVNLDLRRALEPHRLFYPPDPSSYDWCTIGGNLSTNAGGLCCVKYGVTTDFVLGLEVVLADGAVLRTGRRTVKGVAGYDLARLFVGAEGTLGVITQATLALRPLPAAPVTLVATFPSTAAAGRAVSDVVLAGLVPSLMEIMDQTCIRAVDEWKHLGLDRDAHTLLLG